MQSIDGAGALSGTFWGMLFRLLFFVPILWPAVGAAVGPAVIVTTNKGRPMGAATREALERLTSSR